VDSYLKQSTASQSRAIGPFVDDTDFKTLETALTINNTDVKLVKNGGTRTWARIAFLAASSVCMPTDPSSSAADSNWTA